MTTSRPAGSGSRTMIRTSGSGPAAQLNRPSLAETVTTTGSVTSTGSGSRTHTTSHVGDGSQRVTAGVPTMRDGSVREDRATVRAAGTGAKPTMPMRVTVAPVRASGG